MVEERRLLWGVVGDCGGGGGGVSMARRQDKPDTNQMLNVKWNQ